METAESTLAAIAKSPARSISKSSTSSSSATATATQVKPHVASHIIDHEADTDALDVFFFESDHAALKTNAEYENLLKTVSLLEAQRTRAIGDLDKLMRCEKDALADPVIFVKNLQRNVDMDIPKRQNVATLPKIHWDKYTTNVDPLNVGKHKHATRNKRQSKFFHEYRGIFYCTQYVVYMTDLFTCKSLCCVIC